MATKKKTKATKKTKYIAKVAHPRNASPENIQAQAAINEAGGGIPLFGQQQFDPNDPSTFKVSHPNDNPLYKKLSKKLLEPIPPPWNTDLVLTLEEVYGPGWEQVNDTIQTAKQIVFHAGGDSGPQYSPKTVEEVADKMVEDYSDAEGDRPSFFFHLGDVVYSFGESQYYYDQFYEPFRNYPAPILAVPGNHDGMVYKGDSATTLEAFLANFVTETPTHTAEAGSLSRTSMIQPGVYFTLDAPFVTIIGLYSNVLEDPGVISSEGQKDSPVSDEQLTYLVEQLTRAKKLNTAVLVAVHHPPYTYGKVHGASPRMLQDLDNACKKANFWPHAFISGHAHNYQRFTREIDDYEISYIVAGNSGHGLASLSTGKNKTPIRTPNDMGSGLTFENYDDKNLGYLRIVCNADSLRIEYHDTDPGQKAPADVVTIDLSTHKMIAS